MWRETWAGIVATSKPWRVSGRGSVSGAAVRRLTMFRDLGHRDVAASRRGQHDIFDAGGNMTSNWCITRWRRGSLRRQTWRYQRAGKPGQRMSGAA